MSEILWQIMEDLDDYFPRCTYAFHEVAQWPDGELNRLMAAGLIEQAGLATRAMCTNCGDHDDVHYIENTTTGERFAYVQCVNCGADHVSVDWLRVWETTTEQWLQVLVQHFELSGRLVEIVDGRVWRLGKAPLAGASRYIYFACGMHAHDAWRVITDAKFASRALLLVPAQQPKPLERIAKMPVTIPLNIVLSWGDGELTLDREFITEELATKVQAPPKNEPRKYSSVRSAAEIALVEKLIKEMVEHLRAARDHAIDSHERTGCAELLPRPQQNFLAEKLGVSESRVSRAITGNYAERLLPLWELALDVDRVLDFAVHGV